MHRHQFPIVIAVVLFASVWLSVPAGPAMAAAAGPGEGLVVFTRADELKGKAIRFNINVNGQRSLQLLAGSTIELPMPVGTHTFTVHTPSLDGQDSITIDVQEGWTYRIGGEVRWGWPAGRPKFKFISETGPAPGDAPAPNREPEALAGAALGHVSTPPASASAPPARTAAERGRVGLRNFAGNWILDVWSLADDGSKLEGAGLAEGVAEGDDGVRITITEFAAPAFPAATGGGQVRISYEEGKGFALESWFKHSNEVLNLSGQYEPDTGRYVFFMFGSQGQTATGVARASVRVEVRSLDIATWTAETYSSVDGQSMLVQSYRFSRR